MNDHGRYPPHQGHAWRGDWQARLRDLLAALGFQRITDFVRARPESTLLSLVDELGSGDVAQIQLVWTVVNEAEVSGDARGCAMDLLCLYLNGVREGWPANRDWEDQEEARLALIDWKVSLRELGHGEAIERVVRAMLDKEEIAPGWKPGSTKDPILTAIFERYWA